MRATTIISIIGTLLAIILSVLYGVGAIEVIIFTIAYLLTSFGVSAGLHRLFSHRAFKTGSRVKVCFAVLAHLSGQGDITRWVSLHRRHHAFSDTEKDVHSPIKGFWWAHVGWLFHLDPNSIERSKWAPDLLKDPAIQTIDRLLPLWTIITFTLPGLIGWIISGGDFYIGLKALLWGGPLRHFVVLNSTFTINSLTHIFGNRPFKTNDYSGNIGTLSLLTLGESWHNNHHAFPTSARSGLNWWQIDPCWYALTVLSWLGLVTDLTAPSAHQLKAAYEKAQGI